MASIPVYAESKRATRVFDEKLEKLKRYRHEHGHCLLKPSDELYSWSSYLRNRMKNRLLTEDQIHRLKAVGFVFSIREGTWCRNFHHLKNLQTLSGTCSVSRESSEPLFIWCRDQRTQNRKGKLSAERKSRLDSIGFCWEYDPLQQRLQDLGKALRNKDLPRNHASYQWLHRKRKAYKRGALNPAVQSQMESIPAFTWETSLDARWDNMLSELVKFKKMYGHTDVKAGLDAPYPKLGTWVYTQRCRFRNHALSASRVAKLNAIQFQWVSGIERRRIRKLLPRKKRPCRCNISGYRLNVYCNKEDRWYQCKVLEQYDESCFLVAYPEGEVEVVTSSSHHYMVLDRQEPEKNGSEDLHKLKVADGSRLKIYWPEEKRFYAGTLIKIDKSKRRAFKVRYEDGEVRSHDLSRHTWHRLNVHLDGATEEKL